MVNVMPTDTKIAGTGLSASDSRTNLLTAAKTVGRSAARNSSLPILSHIRIAAKDRCLSFMATDLEMWTEYRFAEPIIFNEGGVTVPAKSLTDLLQAMPNGEVTIFGDGEINELGLSTPDALYKLNGYPSDEFPLMPEVKQESKFTIAFNELRDAIKQTLFATSTDGTRAILTGALFIFQGDSLRLVATDTHRLALRDSSVRNGSGASATAIVPSRAVAELLRIIGNKEGDVIVTMSSNQAQFKIVHDTGAVTTLITRLIDGTYPNYERVIPTESTKTITFQCDNLITAVKCASVMAREAANRIILCVNPETEAMELSATSGNVGTALQSLKVKISGFESKFEIAFNSKYLIDILESLHGDMIDLKLTEPLRPGVFTDPQDDSCMCVLMPMQVI